MKKDILICGVGGQGTVLASSVLSSFSIGWASLVVWVSRVLGLGLSFVVIWV